MRERSVHDRKGDQRRIIETIDGMFIFVWLCSGELGFALFRWFRSMVRGGTTHLVCLLGVEMSDHATERTQKKLVSHNLDSVQETRYEENYGNE
jgi:hypothetical protein